MSILMAALKQQQQTDIEQQVPGRFWRNVALVLAFILAMLLGAVAAYFLLKANTTAEPAAVVEPEPAEPAVILAALNTLQTQQVAQAAQEKIAAGLTEAIGTEPAPVKDEFKPQPQVKTVTAGSAEAEPVPASTEGVAVSAELRDKFDSALKATENSGRNISSRQRFDAPAPDIRTLDVALQRQIPALQFEAHVYATSVNQRWVKVNGKTLQEGQWVTADIRIREITPQYVLLEMGAELFSVPALSSWPN